MADEYATNQAANSDATGDRSFLSFFHDTGVQIYKATAAAGVIPLGYVPLRTQNIHFQAGNGETGTPVGLGFKLTDQLATTLKKGFLSETNYFTITSIGIEALDLVMPTAAPSTDDADSVLASADGVVTPIVMGQDITGAGLSRTNGSLIADMWRSLIKGSSLSFSQDGRKCSYLLGNFLQRPSGMSQVNDPDKGSNGLAIVSSRIVFPRGLVLPPRSANADGMVFTIDMVHKDREVDPTQQAAVAATADGYLALFYQFTVGGFLSDARGNPVQDAVAMKAAEAAANGQAAPGK